MMDFLHRLGATAREPLIDWEITPAYTYGLFECRGDMVKVHSKDERYYYFYIDNWQKPAGLCLMERGLRYARILARIKAPQEMVDRCVADQGKAVKEQNYAIDSALKAWLIDNLLIPEDETLVVSSVSSPEVQPLLSDDCLPEPDGLSLKSTNKLQLRSRPDFIAAHQIPGLIVQHNFYEHRHNPTGFCQSLLSATDNQLTAADLATGLTWQRGGTDLSSWRRLQLVEEELNRLDYGGYNTWRLPTIEEALSLLTPVKNGHGLHNHRCFSPLQGYIFTADRRKPGGHWFVDFNQAQVYWAAGTGFSGGFGRFCCDTGHSPATK